MSACPESIERKIWPYIDRELSAREVAEISVHLKNCERCNKIYNQRARESKLYRMAFVESPFGDEFARRFEAEFADSLEQVSAEASAAEIFTFNPPLRQRRLAVMASIAAIALVILLGVALREWDDPARRGPEDLSFSGSHEPASGPSRTMLPSRDGGRKPSPGALGVFENPSARVEMSPITERLPVSGELRPGFVYHSEEGPEEPIELALWDRSRVTIQKEKFRFALASRSTTEYLEWNLEEGKIHFNLLPQENTREFVIQTPDVRFVVTGTEFLLDVYDDGRRRYTEISLYSGSLLAIYQDEMGNEIRKELESGDGEQESWRLSNQLNSGESASSSTAPTGRPGVTAGEGRARPQLDQPVQAGGHRRLDDREDAP